jgi:hypothetical protein
MIKHQQALLIYIFKVFFLFLRIKLIFKFLELFLSENALWNVITSFDINVLRSSFANLDASFHIDSKRVWDIYIN